MPTDVVCRLDGRWARSQLGDGSQSPGASPSTRPWPVSGPHPAPDMVPDVSLRQYSWAQHEGQPGGGWCPGEIWTWESEGLEYVLEHSSYGKLEPSVEARDSSFWNGRPGGPSGGATSPQKLLATVGTAYTQLRFSDIVMVSFSEPRFGGLNSLER